MSALPPPSAEKIAPESFRPPTSTLAPSIRVGSVPYLNAQPLTWAIASSISKAEPSSLAAELRAGKLDVALVPLMEVLEAPAGLYRIVHSVAIGSQRNVYSVYLNYTGALGKIRTVALDPASKTSVELARLVLEKFHRLKPRYVSPDEPADAQLLIGDRALAHRQAHPEQNYLDLGEAWREQTRLPFVFALWAIRLPFWRALGVARQLRKAKKIGAGHLDQIARNTFERIYLTEHLCYDLGRPQKLAIEQFSSLLVEMGRLAQEPKLTFI
jgi:predicted solute-binding protein